MQAIAAATERFTNDAQLRDFLPLLREYAFTEDCLTWLAQASTALVLEFCREVDE